MPLPRGVRATTGVLLLLCAGLSVATSQQAVCNFQISGSAKVQIACYGPQVTLYGGTGLSPFAASFSGKCPAQHGRPVIGTLQAFGLT